MSFSISLARLYRNFNWGWGTNSKRVKLRPVLQWWENVEGVSTYFKLVSTQQWERGWIWNDPLQPLSYRLWWKKVFPLLFGLCQLSFCFSYSWCFARVHTLCTVQWFARSRHHRPRRDGSSRLMFQRDKIINFNHQVGKLLWILEYSQNIPYFCLIVWGCNWFCDSCYFFGWLVFLLYYFFSW